MNIKEILINTLVIIVAIILGILIIPLCPYLLAAIIMIPFIILACCPFVILFSIVFFPIVALFGSKKLTNFIFGR